MFGSIVIISASTMAGLGLLFAGLLGFAHLKLKVEGNKKVTEIEDVLPGLDCGACGYPGCHQLAKNVVEGQAPPDSCVPGGEEVAKKVAELMGLDVSSGPGKMQLAVVHCGAGNEEKQRIGDYQGVKQCRTAEFTTGGDLKCEYGCLGYGDCARACPFDAIEMVDGLPAVDPDKCTACGECVKACPRDIISIEKLDLTGDFVNVACNSNDDGATVRQKCKVGCISCGLCEKVGPDDVFSVEDNLSRMDYSNYDEEADFEMAIEKCPTGCIVEFPSPKEDSETT